MSCRSRSSLAALDELVREGKVRYTGSSHFAGGQVADTGRAEDLKFLAGE